MPKLTPLQKGAAIAGIVAAAVGVPAGLYQFFKTTPAVQQTGPGNVQGDVTASTGGVAIGPGSTVFLDGQHGADEKKQPALDRTILFQCENVALPVTMPASGKLVYIAFQDRFGDAPALSQRADAAPGMSLTWHAGAPKSSWRCAFRNFGSTAVLNVRADMAVSISAPLTTRVAAGVVSTVGSLLVSGDKWSTPTIQVGAGKDDFYIWNAGPNFVEIVLPTVAEVQVIGSPAPQTINLMPTNNSTINLSPAGSPDPDAPVITAEFVRRRKLIGQIVVSYIQQYRPPIMFGSMVPLYEQATPFINDELQKRGESWRFNLTLGREMELLH